MLWHGLAAWTGHGSIWRAAAHFGCAIALVAPGSPGIDPRAAGALVAYSFAWPRVASRQAAPVCLCQFLRCERALQGLCCSFMPPVCRACPVKFAGYGPSACVPRAVNNVGTNVRKACTGDYSLQVHLLGPPALLCVVQLWCSRRTCLQHAVTSISGTCECMKLGAMRLLAGMPVKDCGACTRTTAHVSCAALCQPSCVCLRALSSQLLPCFDCPGQLPSWLMPLSCCAGAPEPDGHLIGVGLRAVPAVAPPLARVGNQQHAAVTLRRNTKA
jgi:hypothetical protein